MAFAGRRGVHVKIDDLPHDLPQANAHTLLFAESNTRFVCEVAPACVAEFERHMSGLPVACIGLVTEAPRLRVEFRKSLVIDAELDALERAWRAPMEWS
jgi:phosphoribosylformylglycinamidine synthase